MQLQQTLSIALLSVLLFSCGGSLDGDTPENPIEPNTPTEPTEPVVAVKMAVSLLNCPDNWNNDISNCTDTAEISTLNPGKVAVKLTQGDLPLAQQVVTLSSTAGEVPVKSDLTRENGIAIFDLLASDQQGAGSITATTNALGTAVSEIKNFRIGATNVAMAISNDLSGATLAQNSTSLITVNFTTDSGEAFTSPVKVTFSSACAAQDKAKLDSSVLAVNGVAQATYQPIGCSGEDTISANAAVNSLSASTTISIASSPAQSIRYLGASPQWIAIKGTGGLNRQETSTLTFKLVDKNGLASNQQNVEFILDGGPSGTVIEPLLAKTNSEGEVSTVISAGKVSGVLRVKAKLLGSDPLIATVSDQLTISTGLPDQNSFSLSLENRAPETWNTDGVLVKAGIRLADHFNNAVPDGTAVYFTTEGGSIKDTETGTLGSCMTKSSKCSLTWESQAPRPQGNQLSDWDNTTNKLAHSCAESAVAAFAPCINPSTAPLGQPYNGGMGQPYAGRVTITAFAVGEESFVDKNGDGWFDSGDSFKLVSDILGASYDLPEVFFDNDENGVYDTTAIGGAEEEFHDYSPVDQQYSIGNKKFNGVLCSEADDVAGVCERKLINVRDRSILIMASGEQYIRVQNSAVDVNSVDLTTATGSGSASLQIYVADINNNRPPAETTIAVETDNGELSGPTEWKLDDTPYKGPFNFSISLIREAEPNKKSSGLVTVTITSPAGLVKTYQIAVSDDG